MDNFGRKWCDDSSQHGVGRPVYLLYDKHLSSSVNLIDFQTTNQISIQISKSTGNLDTTLRGRKGTILESSKSGNDFLEIYTSETPFKSKEDFVWSIVYRHLENQSKIIEDTTGIRLEEQAHFATGRERKFVEDRGALESRQLLQNERMACPITVEARPPNENAYNLHGNTTNNIAMLELSTDNAI
ncbi:3825_t:CDS:1 [Funneliformis geosporum]|uniref:11079_t:CDS:1 n=1 Tax=Funneliformis geosporum TaxID=1117311 RepID=A0A9W4SFW6_9GLOM|nr:3825_t:CDS:1 [Funneliformis geosporum]CAI2166941.1 11079_t:CDS:1 [Funneliformis geosporum]